jgi:hypothetical protein
VLKRPEFIANLPHKHHKSVSSVSGKVRVENRTHIGYVFELKGKSDISYKPIHEDFKTGVTNLTARHAAFAS